MKNIIKGGLLFLSLFDLNYIISYALDCFILRFKITFITELSYLLIIFFFLGLAIYASHNLIKSNRLHLRELIIIFILLKIILYLFIFIIYPYFISNYVGNFKNWFEMYSYKGIVKPILSLGVIIYSIFMMRDKKEIN